VIRGHNPNYIPKLGTKMDILIDKEGIPLSTIIKSVSTGYQKATTTKRKSKDENIQEKVQSRDKTYHSKEVEPKIIRRRYVSHIRHRREKNKICKRDRSGRRGVIEGTNT